MLTNEDIQFIKDTRQEVVSNRRRPLVIEYQTEGERDPVTGEVTGGSGTTSVLAVVTDRTSRVAAERIIREMAEIVEGDIWFSIDIGELEDKDLTPKDIRYATHNEDRYAVVAQDPKGIGEYNRYEFVGKKVV